MPADKPEAQERSAEEWARAGLRIQEQDHHSFRWDCAICQDPHHIAAELLRVIDAIRAYGDQRAAEAAAARDREWREALEKAGIGIGEYGDLAYRVIGERDAATLRALLASAAPTPEKR